ncbi:Membrane-associated phosphatidylinositol transfer protein 1 [Camelus dromedarius]|uniref:Membrane-associated phosphatidylinositol transfer protein 1 n=1 Tax=Camelus dromedarius TaxID=9838 RepID=A0A5N4BYP1_CAMDR|nr:Membrane-associated phosphatidylinositol transfer protein 1 [Camelus dromedarius]
MVVRHWQDTGYLIVYVTVGPICRHRVVAWLSQHNFPHALSPSATALPMIHCAKGDVSAKPVQEVELNIVAGYGSPKDVAVYAALGLPPSQTYIGAAPCGNAGAVPVRTK